MSTILSILGTIGFCICLFVMYCTDHGINGIRKYDGDFRLLDMRFRYDKNTIFDVCKNIGVHGRIAYLHYLLVDYCFIICFFIVMLAISLRADLALRRALFALCVLRACFDIIEDTLLLIHLQTYPIRNMTLAFLCSWSTTLKFLSLYGWIAILLYQFLAFFLK